MTLTVISQLGTLITVLGTLMGYSSKILKKVLEIARMIEAHSAKITEIEQRLEKLHARMDDMGK